MHFSQPTQCTPTMLSHHQYTSCRAWVFYSIPSPSLYCQRTFYTHFMNTELLTLSRVKVFGGKGTRTLDPRLAKPML